MDMNIVDITLPKKCKHTTLQIDQMYKTLRSICVR